MDIHGFSAEVHGGSLNGVGIIQSIQASGCFTHQLTKLFQQIGLDQSRSVAVACLFGIKKFRIVRFGVCQSFEISKVRFRSPHVSLHAFGMVVAYFGTFSMIAFVSDAGMGIGMLRGISLYFRLINVR